MRTDAGLTGIGSSYNSTDLVRAALGRLENLYLGEIAIEPLRVHEKLEQSNFWWGRGGPITHAISGIDIALWDIFGQATGQPVSRLLGGCYRDRVKPYASLSFGYTGDIADMVETLQEAMARGFRAFKLGWGAFGRTGNPADDERLIKTARETVGDLRDHGRSGRLAAVLAARVQVGAAHGRDAGRLWRGLVRGGAAARRPGGVRQAAASMPGS